MIMPPTGRPTWRTSSSSIPVSVGAQVTAPKITERNRRIASPDVRHVFHLGHRKAYHGRRLAAIAGLPQVTPVNILQFADG
tara:strand:- start:188 stop:430 length:243 start_codon:yes stop_codon:yes gene_type:complete